MDSIDLKLLTQLHKNARTSIKELAESVFLSSPATTARIDKLASKKIIKGFHADVDFEALGANCVAIVSFTAQRTLPENFNSFITDHPGIIECYCVAGEYTHIMKVAFKTPKGLYGFVHNLNRYGKTEVSIIMENMKNIGDADIEKLIV